MHDSCEAGGGFACFKVGTPISARTSISELKQCRPIVSVIVPLIIGHAMVDSGFASTAYGRNGWWGIMQAPQSSGRMDAFFRILLPCGHASKVASANPVLTRRGCVRSIAYYIHESWQIGERK